MTAPMTIGEAIVGLAEVYTSLERERPEKGLLASQHPASKERIERYRWILNERLAGLPGCETGPKGRQSKSKPTKSWPPGDHLRRRLRFVGDAAESARANRIVGEHGYLARDYFVRYPAPERGAKTHVPYFFLRLKVTADQPWRFRYGFSAYDDPEGRTRLSPAALMALRRATADRADVILGQRDCLEWHEQGRSLFFSPSMWGGGGKPRKLSDMDDALLTEWADGSDPGCYATLTREEALEISDGDLLDRIFEPYDLLREFGTNVWSLARRTSEPTVFLSYRRDDFPDREPLRELAAQLKEKFGGAGVFWDEEGLKEGGDYRVELMRNAESAWLLVALRGPRYLPWRDADDWCEKECDAAAGAGAQHLWVRVDDAEPEQVDQVRARRTRLDGNHQTLQWHPTDRDRTHGEVDRIVQTVVDLAK